MSEFDFYKAQTKIENLVCAEDRETRKLLRSFAKLKGLRTRRKNLERAVEREKGKLEPKSCGATRPRALNDAREPRACSRPVAHDGPHLDGAEEWNS